jgi:hypothetical protein
LLQASGETFWASIIGENEIQLICRIEQSLENTPRHGLSKGMIILVFPDKIQAYQRFSV